MKPLISVKELQALAASNVRLLDARFRLKDSAGAERLYQEGHIPRALRVDMETDLSGAKTGHNGRHPLPDPDALAGLLSRLGISDSTTVIAYDDTDHAGAARLWFLLRWLGHENVAVLDGGLKAYVATGLPLETGSGRRPLSATFHRRASLVSTFSASELSGKNLVDARAPERYRGEVEPLDPKAGHIPGAKNLPYQSLFGADGRFLELGALKSKLEATGEAPVFYCGSGVTANVTLLAAELVGRPASLFPGSWSEWCSLPDAPVEKGA